MTSGTGGYEPGKLKKKYEKEISKDRIDNLLELISENDFWNLPTKTNDIGFDGSQWIIEGLLGGKYHIIDRWTPEKGSAKEIGLEFIKLSGFKFKEIY